MENIIDTNLNDPATCGICLSMAEDVIQKAEHIAGIGSPEKLEGIDSPEQLVCRVKECVRAAGVTPSKEMVAAILQCASDALSGGENVNA